METSPDKISEVLQQKAKVCETVAADKTQESLTGEPHKKELNEQEAKVWREKSKVWTEAEAIVRTGITDPVAPIPDQLKKK
jgi:hypothetical protein